MHTELQSTSNGLTDGNRAAGVPRFQYNLGADWDIPGVQGAAVNARLLRTGGEYVDAGNSLMAWGAPQVSSWYKSESGRVSQNWPFALVDYWRATLAPSTTPPIRRR